MYIKISVNNKIATLQDNVQIVNGNSDYVIKFDFDSEWDAYETKTARFVTARGYTDVVFSGDEVALPVITDAISVRVGVYAGNLHTTTPAVIFCRRCITDGSGSPVEPTPDVYAQLMEMLNKDSIIWYPNVDDAGTISWVRSMAETEPTPINIKGPIGPDGKDGYTPQKGVDYFDGKDGQDGTPGKDGHTPVKGTDYWTASDKAEVVAEAAAAVDLTPYAKKTEVPTKTSQLTNDSGFLTSHQDISGKQDKATLEADVAAKGFTKNTGTYSKPAGGIPKADLANDVQASLGKANTALQEHQSLAAYRTAAAQDVIDSGKVDKVAGKGLSTNDYTAAAKAKVDAIPANPKYTDTVYDDTALKERVATIEGKESAWDAKSDFSGSYNDLTDKPTIPTIPEYVRTEAETVARIVNQHQSNDSIVFPFLSDAHCGYYTDTGNAATTLAGQLLNQIGKRVPYDFIVNGGDYSTGAWNTTKLNSFEQIEDYTELTSEADKGVLSIWCAGNHDDAPYQATAGRVTQKELFGLVGRKNRMSGAVCPNGCNYGYIDLENRKLRVIYLDTDDKRSWGTVAVGAGETAPAYLNAHNVSGAQLQWLANTGLDFTDKENPAEWSIVVVSHVVLNIIGTITDAVSGTVYAHNTENATKILNAYRTGKSGSITHNGVTVNYDFSAVGSKATVICAVHGHNHKFGTETLTGGILSIGCPNVMNGRERASDDGNTYTKTAGTADGTSFCILTIDRENCVIYADCVGAGYDREFTYTTEVAAYTNQIPTSTDTDGSVYGYRAGYRLNGSGVAEAMSGSYVTGFIPVSIGDTVYMKNVTFKYGVSSGLTSNNQRLSFYNASKAHIAQTNATGLGGVAGGVKGDDGIWIQFTPKSTMNSVDCSGVAYFRINAAYIGDDSIITVNEPIE